jgi:glycosyltransferase involved in cell wall biosynthesis
VSIRVLHVSQPGDGGAARVVADLARDQLARGFAVAVAATPEGELAEAVDTIGARLAVWRAGRRPGPSTLGETRSLARIVAAERPDLVHLHSSKAGLAGRLALRGRVPTLFQPHSWSFEPLRGPLRAAAIRWERRAVAWTTALICVSEGERERGEAEGIRAPYRVIPNGVDLDAFVQAGREERKAARVRLGLAEGPVAVCIARLCRQKGQDILVEAWPEVRARVPEARLVLVGGGPATEQLRAAPNTGVELVGPRDDVSDWLAAADVVAAPSRWEGMSLALLEAMASGRSVVATDVPGVREALGDDAGAVVAPGAVGELADAVAARLLDPALAEAEGAAGRKRAERQHDLRTTHDRIADLYAELLGSPVAPKAANTVASRPAP